MWAHGSTLVSRSRCLWQSTIQARYIPSAFRRKGGLLKSSLTDPFPLSSSSLSSSFFECSFVREVSSLLVPDAEEENWLSHDVLKCASYTQNHDLHHLYRYREEEPFRLSYGGALKEFDIAYECYGQLNGAKDNAVLIHTGLSASAHAKSTAENTQPGWWESFIGPGLAIDTDRFFVICTNVLGSCFGSTGPSSPLPDAKGTEHGKLQRYAHQFPMLSVLDMVRAQQWLLERELGIEKLYASVGSSLGGMQSLAFAALFPEKLERCVSISACAHSHPYSIAMRYLQRRALMSDPQFQGGDYYGGIYPAKGMRLAREISTVSYRSGPEWERRFGRTRCRKGTPFAGPDFEIEKYIAYQSEKFFKAYDPNSLLYISKAMDMFDIGVLSNENTLHWLRSNGIDGSSSPLLSEDDLFVDASAPHDDRVSENAFVKNEQALRKALQLVRSPLLVIGVVSDILFPVWQQREMARLAREGGNDIVTYRELDALYGHDTFLIDVKNIGSALKSHLEGNVYATWEI